MENYPPYTITDKMLNYVSDIMKKIGEANYFKSLNRYPELRRKSRIKSIHSSLAIENNQLSLFHYNLFLYILFTMEMEELQEFGKLQFYHIGKNLLLIYLLKV